MKKTFKAITSLALMLLVIMSMSAGAFAADSAITFKGQAEGFGFQPGSEYTTTDLFDGFKNVMPGDVLTEEITFINSAKDCDFVNLYMRAEPHDKEKNPLSESVAEEEDLASMTDFLSRLTMKVWNGTELIYEASPNESDGLTANKFLGMFRTGEKTTLRVELSVPIELDNKYANRVGEVDWVFTVEAFNESQLSVRKVWSDGNDKHEKESVTVNLLKDGKIDRSQELNAANGWAYTFDRLVEGFKWTVEEAEVPEDYTVSYETDGTNVTITNTKEDTPVPDKPLKITVRKVWSGDDHKNRPKSVTVTLFDGKKAYDTVKLSDENNWTYTWDDPSLRGNWQVIEKNIPKGYVPSYSVSGDVVTITNTRSLIQTGQLNWPVWVLGGAGIALITLGGAMLLKKKKENNA